MRIIRMIVFICIISSTACATNKAIENDQNVHKLSLQCSSQPEDNLYLAEAWELPMCFLLEGKSSSSLGKTNNESLEDLYNLMVLKFPHQYQRSFSKNLSADTLSSYNLCALSIICEQGMIDHPALEVEFLSRGISYDILKRESVSGAPLLGAIQKNLDSFSSFKDYLENYFKDITNLIGSD